MPMSQHPNNATNFSVITSYEFHQILVYLTSDMNYTQEKAREIMKRLPGTNLNEEGIVDYYSIPQSSAWEYFQSIPKLQETIKHRRIDNMVDLLHKAKDYEEKHRDK